MLAITPGRIFATLMVSLMGLGGLAFDGWLLWTWHRARTIPTWPTTDAAVTELSIREPQLRAHPSKGGGYWAAGWCTFVVDGQRFDARIRTKQKSLRSEIETFIAEHPPGSSITVRYNPADPSDAALFIPGFDFLNPVSIGATVLINFFVLIWILMLWQLLRDSRTR